MLVISLHPNKLRTSHWTELWVLTWGWTSGIFAQIQPLVLSPSRMLPASKIRCNSQLQWKHAGGVGNLCQMEVSKAPKKLLISRHSCIDVCKNGVDSCQVHGLFFRWNGWNECFPEFSVPNPYANHQLGLHQFTSSPGDVWFVDSSGIEILCKGLSRLSCRI